MACAALLLPGLLPGLRIAARADAPPVGTLPQVADIKGPDAPGGWDLISLDTTTQRAFIGRETGVSVLDLSGDRTLPEIMPGQHVHIALPLPQGKLLVTNGRAGNATIVDQASGAVGKTIDGLSNPDGAIIEPATGDVLIVEAGNGEIAMADPQSGRLVTRIPVGGRLEMLQADGAGRIWVNVRDRNQVALVDLNTRRVVSRYPLAGCVGPTGLAADTVINRLVVACSNGVAKVLSGTDGKDLGTVPVGLRADGVMLASSTAWIPAADGTLSAISLLPSPKLAGRYATRPGARTGAFNPLTRRFYLPYGELIGQPQARRLRPGSFGVLVLQGQ